MTAAASAAAHPAQLLLAAVLIVFVGLIRPWQARAELRLVLDMLLAELADALSTDQVPAEHPAVRELLHTVQAVHASPGAQGRLALQRLPGRSSTTDLSGRQRSQLQAWSRRAVQAIRAHRRVARPWSVLLAAPRHQRPRAAGRRPSTVQVTLPPPPAPAAPQSPSTAGLDLLSDLLSKP